jgi:hypothetical protein
MTSSYQFTDKANYDNLFQHFKIFLDITNSAPNDNSTLAHQSWQLYAQALQIESNPLESAYKFQGNEREETALIKSMFNALLVFGPLSPDSDYAVCRCGRVVPKQEHYELKNPNADCCKFCVHTYEEDQFNANKLFELPTSLNTDEAFETVDLTEPIPAAPDGLSEPLEWGHSHPLEEEVKEVRASALDDMHEEIEQQVQSSYGPMLKPKRAYTARRKCHFCGGPNLNRKKNRCNACHKRD